MAKVLISCSTVLTRVHTCLTNVPADIVDDRHLSSPGSTERRSDSGRSKREPSCQSSPSSLRRMILSTCCSTAGMRASITNWFMDLLPFSAM